MQIQASMSAVFQSVTCDAYVSHLRCVPLTISATTLQCVYFSYNPVTHKVDTVHGAAAANKPSPSVWQRGDCFRDHLLS